MPGSKKEARLPALKLWERIPAAYRAGTLEEAQGRTLRFEADVPIKIPDSSHWVIAIVRGERAMDDALPFMPIQPLAFSNPIYVSH